MNVVFDTNIYVSAFLFKGGIPSRLLDLARDKRFKLFSSPEILEEFKRVVGRKFGLTLHEQDRLVRYVEGCGSIVYPEQAIRLVKEDEADNRILECALAADADYLVTGDKKHLLFLKHSLSFRILSPAYFFKLFYSKNQG